LLDKTQREKKAKAMVAIGHVRRDGTTFVVSNGSPKARGKVDHHVTRNEDREVVCDCPSYAELREQDEQCEHILAVKEFVKKGEPMARAVREKVKEVEVEESEEAVTFDMPNTMGVTRDQTGENPSWFKTLQQPIPESLIKSRAGWKDAKGKQVYVDYIEWHTAVKLLNAAIGASWSWQVLSIFPAGDKLTICHGRITVNLPDGSTIYRDGIGTGDNNEMGIKGAEHDAIKRAATKFGMALELYDKDGGHSFVPETKEDNMVDAPFDNPKPNQARANGAVAEAAKRQQGNGNGDNPNVATSLTNSITEKQVYFISTRLAEDAGILDIDQECQDVMGCAIEELSKTGASKFIDHLKAKA
jgi:hypothetical protein